MGSTLGDCSPVILTDREIKIAIDRELIGLNPEPAGDAFSSTSVDLTLDPQARTFRKEVGHGINIDPGSPKYKFHEIADLLTESMIIETQFNLSPRKLLLAWTRETLSLPLYSRLAARVEGRSSLARMGISIHLTAPTIHAGFVGQLQLEIINHGLTDIVLRPGMKICQLIFETTLGTPDKAYSGMFSGQKAH